MKLFIEKNIFRLEVTVNNSALVHVLDGGHQLGGVEPGAVRSVRRLVVRRQSVDEAKQVTVLGVCYDKIEASTVLEKKCLTLKSVSFKRR